MPRLTINKQKYAKCKEPNAIAVCNKNKETTRDEPMLRSLLARSHQTTQKMLAAIHNADVLSR